MKADAQQLWHTKKKWWTHCIHGKKISVVFSPFLRYDPRANSKLGELNYNELCNKIEEWANSRLSESVSDRCWVKNKTG